MADIKKILAFSAATACGTAGAAFKAEDANNTGRDDAVGNVLVGVSKIVPAFLLQPGTGALDAALKETADSIYAYLSEKGQVTFP